MSDVSTTGSKFDWSLATVIGCCFLIMLCDGYDLTVIAFAMPAIGKQWHVPTADFSYVFSASIVGVMIGAPISGWLADHFGRKRVLLWCIATFGAAVLLTCLTRSLPQLVVARAVSGLGLGGVMPLAIALVGEQSPRHLRATLISVATTGMTIGAGLPALAAALMLPTFGWPALFFIGGITPFAIGLLALFYLPESRQFSDLSSKSAGRNRPDAEKSELRELFSHGYARFTPLLWVVFSAIGFASYFIQTWTPTLYLGLGRPLRDVAFSVSMFQVGGALGGLLVGWVLDRFGPKCIPILFLLAAPSVAILAFPNAFAGILPLALGVSGFLLLALQLAANALAAISYPTRIRGLGIGCGLASARLGQILSSTTGGALVSRGADLLMIFGLLAVIMLAGAIVGTALTSRAPPATNLDN